MTGGRLKIGFETALKLLRSGADVTITTRFVDDASARFAAERDVSAWQGRLRVLSADFRSLACIHDVIEEVRGAYARLDILVNNAAQTLRRPPAFYRHLLRGQEPQFGSALSLEGGLLGLAMDSSAAQPGRVIDRRERIERDSHIAWLSQIPLLPGDEVVDEVDFPTGRYDEEGQQEDHRTSNSWVMRLEDVDEVEFLEVMYINLIAPFLLTSRLKDLMQKRSADRPSFVVNVTAMEGNFFYPDKSWRHPHTNMAKAALNMMTRTSASQFMEDGIYMTAVDPGWITDEWPYGPDPTTNRRQASMPIDTVDGAARICDPIFRAVNDGQRMSGVLLKNYEVYPW